MHSLGVFGNSALNEHPTEGLFDAVRIEDLFASLKPQRRPSAKICFSVRKVVKPTLVILEVCCGVI